MLLPATRSDDEGHLLEGIRRSGLPMTGPTRWVCTMTSVSLWIRNLEHQPSTDLWMRGERRPIRAQVMTAERGTEPEEMDDRLAQPVFSALRALVAAGFSVSVLEFET